SGGISNISNSTGYSAGGYADYTSQFVSQYAGNNVSFSATIVGVTGQVGVGVWVDWNNNGDFVDTGEKVYNTNGNFISSNPSNISFSVPAGQTIGSYRMRIIVDYNSATPVPCVSGTVNAGEAEDYTFTVLASTVPPAPTAVVATPGVGQASVAFTAPTNNGGSTITSYTVTASGGLTGTGSGSPIVVSGLTGGAAYTFTVTATNGIGAGAASSPSSSVVIPLSATVATAASPIAVTSFTANWGVVSGITGYKLDVSTNSNFFVTTTPVSSDFETNLFTGWSNTTNWVIINASPITGTYSLRINAASSQQTNYIYTQPTTYDVTNSTTTWRFNIKTNYAPSANNKAFFYLMSNQTNLAGTSSNGYVVGFNFSGTDDLIKLWKSTAGVVDGSPLLASTQAVVSGTIYGIEVTRTSTGVWTLKYKSGGGFTSMTTVSGSATDATYTNSSYSGLVSFTTSSNAQDLRFDDFSINNAISTLLASYTDLDVASTSHSVTGLSANTNYYYRVRAINAISTSSNSNTISVSTKAIGTADYRSKAAGNFSSVANWEYNNTGTTYINATQLPLSTNDVSIIHAITLDADYTVASGRTFIISSGGSLIVSPTSTLTIAGTANFGGQSVTLQSTDVFNGGAIGVITGTLSSATNVTIQRYSRAQRGYRTLANPYNSAQVIAQLTDNFRVTGLNATNGTYGVTTNLPSVFSYNPTAVSPTNPLTPITDATASSWGVGQGLYVFIRGNADQGLAGPGSANYTSGIISPVVLDVTGGTVNQGNIIVNFRFSNGANNYNLLGNPYPSAINLKNVASLIGSVIYVYNPVKVINVNGANQYTIAGGFDSYTNDGATEVVIPSMGGFYVKATSDNQPITFEENDKVAAVAPTNVVFGADKNPGFTLAVNTAKGEVDNVRFRFNNTSVSAATDTYDAPKLANSLFDFYSLSADNKRLTIDYRSDNMTDATIPLGINTSVNSNYTISLSAFKDLPNTQLVLRDKLLNTETPLVAVGDSYNFSITADAATKGDNRFEIGLSGITVLPTKLTSFTAQLQSSKTVAVNWATASEVNADYYQVQRSTNGSSFTSIGKVAAKGAGNYTYNDDLSSITPQPSTIYYRLQMVDKDGSVAYSKVASCQLSFASNKALVIYPNPVQATLFAEVTAGKAGKVTMVVTDMQGKQLRSQTAAVNAGITALSIDANGLAAGSYVLIVTDSDGEQQKQQFVKQ
ncbi:MAG: T9SS type A sorting domain-containing protein, partial [Deinococcales bacterium]|nr:T9SS type A sorting domain-containing protein [Chitinophagaceae bacterium]